MTSAAGYYRHPTIHGDRVVFVCEDDLWEVGAAGGVPRRLTSSPGIVSFPVFSPDGSRIAFTGRDDGPAEAYVMPAEGGEPRRVTWYGAGTTTVAWTPDGACAVVATDARQPFRGLTHLRTVDPTAPGADRPLGFGPARAVSWEPAGPGRVIGRNSGDPARWKRYRGGTAGTIWIDRAGTGDWAPLVELPGNLASPAWIVGRVYFLSDHEGHGNIYSCAPDGTGVRRHTGHEDFYVRFPSTDGRRIAYHAGADLWVFDPASGRSDRIPVRWSSSRPQRSRRFVPAAPHLESAELHPAGHSLAAVVRGGVHTTALWDGAPAAAARRPGVRHRLARWLADGRRLVAVTDEGGEEALVVLAADGSERRTLPGDVGRPFDLAASPAGPDRAAVLNQRRELIVVDLATGAATVAARSEWDRIDGVAWSPDGRYLAYGFPVSRRNVAIHVWDSQTGLARAVTRPDFRDVAPAFDPEGKHLHFVSWRDFDPVYDSHYFDLGFPKGSRPMLVTLRADLPSPFAAGQREPRGPDGAAPDAPKPAAAKDAPDAAPPEVRIDFDGIEDRVVAYPVPEGRYVSVRAVPGRTLFLSWPVEGSLAAPWGPTPEPEAKGVLEAWDFAADECVPVMCGVTSFDTAAGGRAILVRAGNRVRVLPAGAKAKDLPPKDAPGRDSGWVDLDRLRVAVVPGDEWRQMFREAWRLQRDQFWTPDMSQVDWTAVHDRYLPLVDRAATRAEFSDVLWEMQGELNTSHAYEMGGDYRPAPAWFQGCLGADLSFDGAAGGWRVDRIPRGDSWSAAASSPLAAPGVGVRAGDVIVAVDGEPVGPDAPPALRLVHQADRDVRVAVRAADGAVRTVTVRTLRDETPLRYRDWVEANRARVHEATGGRAGYVHVPDMGPRGYAEFHRYYQTEADREGLVVDVRWNGGGHVSQLLLEKLARVRRGWCASRWMPPSPYPDGSPMGPMVALTNEYAGSDGDMFSHCFKLYGLGPLIGVRTWGGVVGIWPRHSLVDGTMTTQPEFAHWFHDVGWGLENFGTEPDIPVVIRPQDHAAGRDPQLERGIGEVMRLVRERPPGVPDLTADRPVRRPPGLPPADRA